MAVRLNVLLIQTPPPTSAAGSMIDEIVGQLIAVPGVDLMLVRSPHHWEPESTDRLTLENLQNDVAVLDWVPIEQSADALRQVCQDHARTRHENDADAPPPRVGSKCLFLFDLGQFETAVDVVDAIHRIQESRQVRTFQLFGTTAAPQKTTVDPVGTNSETRENGGRRSTSVRSNAVVGGSPKSSDAPPSTDSMKAENHRATKPASPPDNNQALDQLLDELDELDP
ncbi:hypothetical protein [Crateriforma conspicua]|uniref:Uncharacterized protein n=1 Tax=Crateriforma conspicua TaxID=2527996 RepID=A0A5C5Y4V9_9PLAN|nr:hypothetical protein [Crateriforma conspicua]QDV64777.1 hypothetical protein Mal65_39400 [Crateriforma conspicua]TWT70174.1 hypothetical protein Pan14r_24740 [Crateriforma conspicua]